MRRFIVPVLALLVGVAAGIAGWRIVTAVPPPIPPSSVRMTFPGLPGGDIGAGDDTLDAAISPDERRIVFVATVDGVARLWLRTIDGKTLTPLAGTEGARLPAWKRTGNVVSFFTGDRLRQIAVDTAIIQDLAPATDGAGATWLDDGSLLYATGNGPIRHMRAGTISEVTALSPGDRAHLFPARTGRGEGFVYMAARDDGRRVIRLRDGLTDVAAGRDLTEAAASAQVAGDYLLYVRDGVVMAQRLAGDDTTPAGRPTSLNFGVGMSAAGRAFMSASPRLLLAAPAGDRRRSLTWFDTNGTRRGTVGDPGDYWQVRLSPDDGDAAATVMDPLLKTLDVVIVPLDDVGLPEPLSLGLSADSDPAWSSDGGRVLFRTLQDGVPSIYSRTVHAREAKDEPLIQSELDETPSDWRGDIVLFHAPARGSGSNVWQYEPKTRAVTGVATTGFNESDARLSPDGRWVAFVTDESGQPDIYASPFPEGERVRVSIAGGSRPRWSRDGNTLYFVRDEQIMRAGRVGASFSTAAVVATVPGVRDFSVANRSDRLLVVAPADTARAVDVSALIDWAALLGR